MISELFFENYVMISDVDEFDNFQPICKYTIQVLFFVSLDGVSIINNYLDDYNINYFLYLRVSYWINQCSYLCIFLFTTGVFYKSDLKIYDFSCLYDVLIYLPICIYAYVCIWIIYSGKNLMPNQISSFMDICIVQV